jgi:hypothetical protein
VEQPIHTEIELKTWIETLWLLSVTDRKLALLENWTELHGPLHFIEATEFTDLFRSVGVVRNDESLSLSPTAIFRGAPSLGGASGISWSATESVARQYAKDYRTVSETTLWKATCPPGAVLARFKQDDEVVVDPNLLSEITPIELYPIFTMPVLSFKNFGGQSLGQLNIASLLQTRNVSDSVSDASESS